MRTGAVPEGPGAIVTLSRPAGSRTGAGSTAQLQADWASVSEATSGAAPGIMTAAVNVVRT